LQACHHLLLLLLLLAPGYPCPPRRCWLLLAWPLLLLQGLQGRRCPPHHQVQQVPLVLPWLLPERLLLGPALLIAPPAARRVLHHDLCHDRL
jgi:hypothetical protein